MALLWLALFNPRPRSHAAKAEPLHEALPSSRQLAVILNPIKVEDVEQFRAIVGAPWPRSPAGRSRRGSTRPSRTRAPAWPRRPRSRAPTWSSSAAATARCARCAPSWPAPASRSGIVPAGTGNLLARNLDIPLYLRSAIDVALNGQDRAIDLVEVSGDGFEDTHFMVMAGMGLDAAIMEGVNEDIKQPIGWIAYVLSGLKSLMFPAVKVEIAVDGGEFTRTGPAPSWSATSASSRPACRCCPTPRSTTACSTSCPAPQAVPVLDPAGRAGAQQGQAHRRDDRPAHRPVRRHPRLADTPRQLDGDSIGPGRELRMQCVHGRLLVRVPR